MLHTPGFNGRFLGYHARSLDKKGRTVVPNEYRSECDSYIFYDHPTKPALIVCFRDTPLFGSLNASQQGLLAAFTTAVNLDDAGRITLTSKLKEKLGLTSDDDAVVFVGAEQYFEIWSQKNWAIESLERLKRVAKFMAPVVRHIEDEPAVA